MPIKLFHTADLHLGMTFGGRNYPEDVRRQLIDARFQTLERLVELADQERCRLFIVAGDLFHRTNMARETVARTAKILARFQGCVAVLPGNHDYYEPFGSLWKDFRDNSFDNLILLTEMRPYALHDYGLEAALYPAPCDGKHSTTNRLSWIGELSARPAARWHIGVGHGSVNGVSPDFHGQYFPMEERELASLKLDHWCLGHTHVRYPDLELAHRRPYFYSGTPEPDGFDCRHGGFAWIAELDDAGNLSCRSVETGRFRFREVEKQLLSADELTDLKEALAVNKENTLLKLKLMGTLPEAEYSSRNIWYNELRETLLYLEKDDSGLDVEITASVIDSRFPVGSFPQRLLSRLIEKDNHEALQLAYRLISEVKK